MFDKYFAIEKNDDETILYDLPTGIVFFKKDCDKISLLPEFEHAREFLTNAIEVLHEDAQYKFSDYIPSK